MHGAVAERQNKAGTRAKRGSGAMKTRSNAGVPTPAWVAQSMTLCMNYSTFETIYTAQNSDSRDSDSCASTSVARFDSILLITATSDAYKYLYGELLPLRCLTSVSMSSITTHNIRREPSVERSPFSCRPDICGSVIDEKPHDYDVYPDKSHNEQEI